MKEKIYIKKFRLACILYLFIQPTSHPHLLSSDLLCLPSTKNTYIYTWKNIDNSTRDSIIAAQKRYREAHKNDEHLRKKRCEYSKKYYCKIKDARPPKTDEQKEREKEYQKNYYDKKKRELGLAEGKWINRVCQPKLFNIFFSFHRSNFLVLCVQIWKIIIYK